MGSGSRRGRTGLGRRYAILATALTLLVATVGCSSSRDVAYDETTPTTIRRLPGAGLDEANLAGGSAAAKDMQRVIDRLVASNDPCAILTQKEVKGYQIDPSSLASSDVLEVLANGVIDIYDHLVVIVPDPGVVPALRTQRDTFVRVLDVVDRYAANPTSKDGTTQIRSLTQGSDFVKAGSTVSAWTYSHCS